MTFLAAAQLVPIGYGIRKVQITAVIEDAKVRSSTPPPRNYSSYPLVFPTAVKEWSENTSTWKIEIILEEPFLADRNKSSCYLQVESMDSIIEEELVRDGESECKSLPATALQMLLRGKA